MAALVLVDLDNLLRVWQGDEVITRRSLPLPRATPAALGRPADPAAARDQTRWLEAYDDAAPGGAPAGGDGSVVVVALNAGTARHVSRRYLRRLVERLGVVLSLPGTPALEVALTLPMPQTADAVLVRLLLATPVPENRGSFRTVWLISRDGGLQRQVWRRLHSGQGTWQGQHPIAGLVHRFVGIGPTPPRHGRTPQQPQRPSEDVLPEPLPVAWSARVDTPGRALTAAGLPLGFSPNADLPELASAVLNRPGLLSHIGATTSSLRGVARLSALVAGKQEGAVTLGACGPTDGLELHLAAELRGEVPAEGLEPAGAGIGAVHSRGLQATVSTRLPFPVLAAPKDPPRATFAGGWGHLRDDLVLAALPPLAPVGSVRVCLTASQRSQTLKAEVESRRRDGQPDAWWLSPRGSGLDTRSAMYLEGLGRLLPDEVGPVDAALAVDETGQGLLLVSPHHPGADVELPAVVRSYQIGLGRAGKHAVAILNGAVPLPRGSVRCSRVQDIDRWRLRALLPDLPHAAWDRLLRLPLCVPLVPLS